ncbi:ZN574 protein, partial [Asarcornis scutulata]|nr:ZN574 protein [Asarcornis scutulata]
LFTSQDVWLAHRQSHRGETPGQALVDLEHSYPKAEELSGAGGVALDAGGALGGISGGGNAVQLLLYECGECLQLFQSPKDFVEHQAG